MNRILHPVATVLVLAFAVLAAFLAVRTGLFQQAAFQPNFNGHARSVLYVLLLVAGIVWFARRRGWARAPVAIAVAAAAGLVFAGIGAVATVALALLSAFCLGRRLLPAPTVGEPGGIAMALALGLACQSLAVGALSFFPVASAATYLALMLLPIAWGFAASLAALRAAWDSLRAADPARTFGEDALVVAIGTALALQVIAVLQPEFGFDALNVHLAIVDQLRMYGRAEYDVAHLSWAVMPMGADWVFALVALPGGEAAARLMNFAAEGILLAVLYGYVAPRAGRAAALLGVALYALTPLVYLETTSLYVDTLWALWLVAALAAASRTLDDGDWRWVFAAAALFGTAMSTKVISVYALPFLVAAAVAWVVRRRPTLLRDLALATGGVALFGALPYANAWLRTGNPVFPFFNHVFRSPLYSSDAAFDNVLYHQPLGWKLLHDVTFGSSGFLESANGALGLLWFVLLPVAALLVWRAGWRHAVAFVLAIVFVLGVFASQSYLRYVLPMFAVLAALVALALAPWARERVPRGLLGLVVALGAGAGLVLYFVACWPYRSLRLPPGPDDYARREFARGINDERLVPAVLDALQLRQVLWLGKPLLAGSHARIEVVNWFSLGNLARYNALASREDARAWIGERDFDAIVVARTTKDSPCAHPGFCEFLERDTTLVYEAGEVAVHRVNADVLFDHELLANPGFDGGATGWAASGVADPATGLIRVDQAGSRASQRVQVRAGTKYRLEAQVACVAGQAPGQLRLQVNWLDSGDDLVSLTLRPVDCGQDAPQGQTVVAPAGAVSAVVHLSAHAPGESVDVDRVSLRQ